MFPKWGNPWIYGNADVTMVRSWSNVCSSVTGNHPDGDAATTFLNHACHRDCAKTACFPPTGSVLSLEPQPSCMTGTSLTGLVTWAATFLTADIAATFGIGALTLGLIGLLWYLSQENITAAEA